MMYNNKFVACIKVDGKVLRENDSTVALPFGAEYQILLKNLNSVRALVKVQIDGEDVADGTQFIIEPNSSLPLERFVKNRNFNSGNKFKFIERTSKVEEHRGIGAEDGLVRIEYRFEKVYKPDPLWNNTPWYNPGYPLYKGGLMRSMNVGSPTSYGTSHPTGLTSSMNWTNSTFSDSFECTETSTERSLNDAGITVAGGESKQKFTAGAWFATETFSSTIVLKLKGKVKGQEIVKPVSVSFKPTCSTCGHVNKATHKFCVECGTSLQIFGGESHGQPLQHR